MVMDDYMLKFTIYLNSFVFFFSFFLDRRQCWTINYECDFILHFSHSCVFYCFVVLYVRIGYIIIVLIEFQFVPFLPLAWVLKYQSNSWAIVILFSSFVHYSIVKILLFKTFFWNIHATISYRLFFWQFKHFHSKCNMVDYTKRHYWR